MRLTFTKSCSATKAEQEVSSTGRRAAAVAERKAVPSLASSCQTLSSSRLWSILLSAEARMRAACKAKTASPLCAGFETPSMITFAKGLPRLSASFKSLSFSFKPCKHCEHSSWLPNGKQLLCAHFYEAYSSQMATLHVKIVLGPPADIFI